MNMNVLIVYFYFTCIMNINESLIVNPYKQVILYRNINRKKNILKEELLQTVIIGRTIVIESAASA